MPTSSCVMRQDMTAYQSCECIIYESLCLIWDYTKLDLLQHGATRFTPSFMRWDRPQKLVNITLWQFFRNGWFKWTTGFHFPSRKLRPFITRKTWTHLHRVNLPIRYPTVKMSRSFMYKKQIIISQHTEHTDRQRSVYAAGLVWGVTTSQGHL